MAIKYACRGKPLYVKGKYRGRSNNCGKDLTKIIASLPVTSKPQKYRCPDCGNEGSITKT